MKKTIPLFLIYMLVSVVLFSQDSKTSVSVENSSFDKEISSLLRYTVPVISVDDLLINQKDYVILDARELEEFNVSHIPCALHLGYKDVQYEILEGIEKSKPIAVYCSVGYRSEKIGEKLKKRGYQNVYNVYGSIFEWANQGNVLIDGTGAPTIKIHTYNKAWSRWVNSEEVEKVW